MHGYLLVQLLKYVLEGLAVAVAAYLVANTRKVSMRNDELFGIGLAAAATFAVLDVFAPSIAVGSRQGAGFGLGATHVGFGVAGEGFSPDVDDADDAVEGFADDDDDDADDDDDDEEAFDDYDQQQQQLDMMSPRMEEAFMNSEEEDEEDD